MSDWETPNYQLKLLVFKVIKETDKGYWIGEIYGSEDPKEWGCIYGKRFILKRESRKKYARETKEKALQCYIYRTKCRVGHLKRQLDCSESGLAHAKILEAKANL